MKLLIITQVIDKNNPVLGFFHNWISKFSPEFKLVTAIGLQVGDYDLPNVRVLSLGKETGRSRLKYLYRFYKYIWQERKNYDMVFVHMNQEYILLAGWWWFLVGKKVYLWRNHHAGSWLTDLAALFCEKVFCTSKYSYTAKYKKTVLMPVGVDTEMFKSNVLANKIPSSILFLGRISPTKKPHLLVEALHQLNQKGVDFRANFYGDSLLTDNNYYDGLKKQVTNFGLSDKVKFQPGIPNTKTVDVYNQHKIFVNLSSSGMYDKTIFEAMSVQSLILCSNLNLIGLIDEKFLFTEDNVSDLVFKLSNLLNLNEIEADKYGLILRQLVESRHSLKILTQRLKNQLENSND